ncbi:MAG: hypothetical protein KC478_09065 [Bacteriovoracaceae bacterium]|nr:hypothetical protein [Bacteriovoracaceae bacterium]
MGNYLHVAVVGRPFSRNPGSDERHNPKKDEEEKKRLLMSLQEAVQARDEFLSLIKELISAKLKALERKKGSTKTF